MTEASPTSTPDSVGDDAVGDDAVGALARERTAERLLVASSEHAYDPEVEIDWTARPVPGAYYGPPHRSSLYGTPLWEELDHARRVELTKHEVASIASVGIWFEVILMQLLVRHVYDRPPTSRHVQYALTEIADECRHSVMFGRLIETLGTPPYGVGHREHRLGRWLKTTASGPHMFAAILIAEEILDALQREAAADESVQPLIRQVSRIHVVEEARHVRFARDELARQVAAAGPTRLAYSRLVIGRAAWAIGRGLIHPRVYAAVGIDPGAGRAVARSNPEYAATLRFAASRIVAYLTELGLIAGPAVRLWRAGGLIA